MRNFRPTLLLLACTGGAWGAAQDAAEFETPHVRFRISTPAGRWEVLDKNAGVTWRSTPWHPRFGDVTLQAAGRPKRLPLERPDVRRVGDGLEASFRPSPDVKIVVRISPKADGRTLEFSWSAPEGTGVESLRLLEDALWTTSDEKGYALVPVREGLLVPADSGKTFTHRFDTSAYEGCHMQMIGVVKAGAAALVTWDDLYVAADLRSARGAPDLPADLQVLSTSMELRKTASSLHVRFLGRGDAVSIARAYRETAKERGLRVTLAEKEKTHPSGTKLEGAINFKLWSTLSRKMSEDSTKEESVRVHWTFDQAARIAEHLHRDLQLEKVFFIMGGWVRRGYDNQHPDILPAAPECGGNDGFADGARRIRAQGYLLGLHDNYQDMYRDAPSWDESFLMKCPDGSLAKGGRWAGGRAWLTCSKKAVELARRPQNLPAVRALTSADACFIDTTTAAGLCECSDPAHPLTRADDLKWKLEISRYAREVFGLFGSECGREWAVPDYDFFEGLTGVSGRHYHDVKLAEKLGAAVVPLFEMVYRDCIALYGKYGYDVQAAAEYVLHHLAIGRPLHYHSVPDGLYWEAPPPPGGSEPLAVRPPSAEVTPDGPRRFKIAYRWKVGKPIVGDWRVLVHFTDPQGAIRFQNDHVPDPPTSQWKTGDVALGPFAVGLPEGLSGPFDVRVGLFREEAGRARLAGKDDGERRHVIGRIVAGPAGVAFEPAPAAPAPAGDPGLFARADRGWAAGFHPLDRFVKNTYEILSPLHASTARVPLSAHAFLTPDRKVQRSVFGEGEGATEVVVNAGAADWRHASRTGGEAVLPPFGFLVESPNFVAFHARAWDGMKYEDPPLFTLTSLDGQPLGKSKRVRIYHGFGDDRVRAAGGERRVPREAVVQPGP
jgi:hypothetical protein